jgi:pyruvate formate lyase activating enzyme
MLTGLVGNIQYYSIHDGPGIRSTVFLKGCPLSCLWCHNPEDISYEPQVRWQKEKCIACGDCAVICSEQALRLGADGVGIDDIQCSRCGKCAAVCPTLALELIGKAISVQETLALLKKDAIFYESSGGGVTVSGGEPLGQAEFTLALLKALRREGIHTALDTCGQAPWPQVAECAAYTDLFLYDIKHLDAIKHEHFTGADNKLILSNLRRLAGQGAHIWLRTPVLPGINDDPQHIAALGDLARELGIREVYLLPYHHLAAGKYEKLGLTYKLPDLAQPTMEHMEELRQILLNKGLNAHIGG